MDGTAALGILKEALVITLVVTALMMAIEALNYFLKGKMSAFARKGRFAQVLTASLLGAVPGCTGGYISVSLYSRGMFSFGALLAMMVSTTGDEAFLMLALFPKTALIIFVALFALGLAAGLVYDALTRRKKGEESYISGAAAADAEGQTLRGRLLHILPHALKVFVWTFGIMIAVEFAGQYVDVPEWIKAHPAVSILAAVVVGLVPQSGPHMAFVKLFADGVLPLSALIASCIVQEGHAGLPLLSQDKKAFVRGKLIKVALALIIAGLMSLAGL